MKTKPLDSQFQLMVNILHLETTTLNCGVALFSNGKVISSKSIREEGYSHAENIMPFIDEIFSEVSLGKSDLDAVSVSGGPGSYTGLRIGVATAKGICHALNLPLIAVDTLSVLKNQALALYPNVDSYVSMLDARRMEVYSRSFSKDSTSEVEAIVINEESISRFDNLGSICFIGDGVEKCTGILNEKDHIFHSAYPCAEHAIELAETAFDASDFVDLASYEPFYLKAFKAGVAKDPFNLRDKSNRIVH